MADEKKSPPSLSPPSSLMADEKKPPPSLLPPSRYTTAAAAGDEQKSALCLSCPTYHSCSRLVGPAEIPDMEDWGIPDSVLSERKARSQMMRDNARRRGASPMDSASAPVDSAPAPSAPAPVDCVLKIVASPMDSASAPNSPSAAPAPVDCGLKLVASPMDSALAQGDSAPKVKQSNSPSAAPAPAPVDCGLCTCSFSNGFCTCSRG